MKPYRFASLLIVFLLPCFFQKLQGQHKDIKFHHITVEHGLAGNTVNCVIRDSRGFIWISTENGVSLFNGYNFINFRSAEKDPFSLASNITYVVFEDNKQRLWVGSEKGLDLYNRNLNRFDRHFFKGNPVRSIYQDKQGNLWIGSDFGLYLYDENKKSFYLPFPNLFNDKNIIYNTIPSLTEDHIGNLWIGTTNGIYVFDPSKKTFKTYKHNPTKKGSLSNNEVRKIVRGKNHKMWVATYGGGLNEFDREKDVFTAFLHAPDKPLGISNNALPTIWEDEKGKLWIGTDGNGVDIYDPVSGIFQHVLPSHYNSRSLNNNVIRSISSDGRGGLWIGTFAGGINFFNQNTAGFFHFKAPTFNGNNSITSFAEDKAGDLWIGTDGGGLTHFDRNTGKFVNYINDPRNPNSLSDNRILSLLMDKKEDLWIGTYLGGLCKFNLKSKRFQRFQLGDQSLLNYNIIWALLQDSKDRIWVASNNGLNLYDETNNSFKNINIKNSNLSNNMVRSLFEDHKKRLWVGTQGGLNLFNESVNSFTVIKSDLQKVNSLSNHWIRTINQDSYKNIWVGTFDGGLNLYDERRNSFHTYSELDGLPDNMISGILGENNGNLWISTGKGLAWLNLRTKKIKCYYSNDGLQDNHFNINAVYKTSKGEFLFGGTNGFTLFIPEVIRNLENNKFPPQLAFTSFKVFNKEAIPRIDGSPLRKDINETKEIILAYDQSVITFEFAALNYIQSEDNLYAYKLEGFDNDWNFVGNQRSATYTNLDPGTYTFRVKAANNDNVWNDVGRSIKLTITPPFWETLWFKIIVAVFVLFVAYLIYDIIRKRIREKIKINKIIAELETKALIAQMNPHFIFNCLTSIQELILVNKQNDAMHYLHQFSKLLRSVLESSEKNFIPLELEITLLELYLELESLRFDNQFHYKITVDKDIDTDDITIPSFLIQPFVENALWHGLMQKKGDRTLLITFSLETSDLLCCKIIDNGIGREAAAKNKRNRLNTYQSMGIKIIKERLNIMKKQNSLTRLEILDDVDSDGQAIGTTVTITLPINLLDENTSFSTLENSRENI